MIGEIESHVISSVLPPGAVRYGQAGYETIVHQGHGKEKSPLGLQIPAGWFFLSHRRAIETLSITSPLAIDLTTSIPSMT
jgi:hypothetical protein